MTTGHDDPWWYKNEFSVPNLNTIGMRDERNAAQRHGPSRLDRVQPDDDAPLITGFELRGLIFETS